MTRSRDVADTQDNLGGAVAPYVAGKNAVINGAFDIWQRGTSSTNTGNAIYLADRWNFYYVAAGTLSQQTAGLDGFTYCQRFQRTAGQTNTGAMSVATSLETVNSIPFQGKTVTLSLWARAGANYSSASNLLTVTLKSGTGTNENVLFGYTGLVNVIFQGATLTTSWQRFSFTGTVGSTATELAVQIFASPTGTAGANDYFEVTGVQLELGAAATPFSRAGGSIGGELALCQRYYFDGRQGSDQAFSGYTISTDYLLAMVRYPVTMRTTPSITIGQSSGVNYVRRISTNGQLLITVTSYPGSTPGGFGAVYASAAPFVAAVGYDFYILASAEL